jgi:hypothetical protein
MNEKRREKFVELAERRVNNALKQMKLIGKLANKSNYSYSEKDAKKIIKALNDEIRILKVKFDEGGEAEGPMFKLS